MRDFPNFCHSTIILVFQPMVRADNSLWPPDPASLHLAAPLPGEPGLPAWSARVQAFIAFLRRATPPGRSALLLPAAVRAGAQYVAGPASSTQESSTAHPLGRRPVNYYVDQVRSIVHLKSAGHSMVMPAAALWSASPPPGSRSRRGQLNEA